MTEPVSDVADFDAAPAAEAAARLRPSCASSAWIDAVVAARPYRGLAALTARSDEVLADLTWGDVEQALAAHPRIGDLAAHPRIGDRASGAQKEAAWSRQEQSAADPDDAVAAGLRAGNIEYEQRFGHVFLICATGRSAPELLAALRQRLGNDATTEREVVRGELRAIVRLRLAKTFR